MKIAVRFLLIAFLCQSCITIKVYQTEDQELKEPEVKTEVRTMLPMGKTIELHGKPNELQFFGDDTNQFELFNEDADDSLKVARIHVFTHKDADSTMGSWTTKGGKANIMVFRTDTEDGGDPLMIVDGVRVEKSTALSDIDPEKIATIEVLKGDAAVKKYGQDAKNGVVEITTKKD